MMELMFIKAVSFALDITEQKVIERFNKGQIYVFDLPGIKKYYSEIIDYPMHHQKITRCIEEDIKNKELHRLDKNTYIMWGC